MKETLVLLPGLLCDAALWQYQIKALEEKVNILVPDTTAHESMEDLATEVLSKAPTQFSLAGLSMGGYVALEIMRQAPMRVSRLALIDTSARADNEETKSRRRGLIELAQKGDFKGVTPRLLPLLIATNRLTDKTITNIIMDMALRVGMPAFLRQQRAILGRIDSRPFLSNIKIQTMIVCGQNDALTPPDHAKEMADMIEHSQLHIIEGAGHLAPLESPDKVNPLLLDWLTR